MSNVNIKKGKSKRIFYFDALRALAIISVILFHVFQNLSYVVVWDYLTIPSLNCFIADFLGTFFSKKASKNHISIFIMGVRADIGNLFDINIHSRRSKHIPAIQIWNIFLI